MANLSNINGKFVVEQTTGYVGIGNTDPAFPLEVKFASAELALNATGASIYRLKSDSTDYFRINKNGVGDRLVISGGGDVGIGTSSPAHKLAIEGGADTVIQMSHGSGAVYNWALAAQYITNNAFEIVPSTVVGGSVFTTPVATFKSDGNVGIGTTAPGGKLHIKGDGDAANLIRLQHDGTGTNGYFDINVTDTEANLIANYSSTAIPMRFLTGAAERMRIDSTGRVTFGPDAQDIQIDPASTNSGNNLIYMRGNASDDKSSLQMNHYGHADYYIGVGHVADGKFNIANDLTGNDFVIDTSGNVGIGTDSPQIKLQITGNSTNSFLLDPINSSIGQNIFYNGSAWDSVNHSVAGSIMQLGTDGSFAFRRATAADPPVLSYSMYIDSNGKVGIGTTSPSQSLDTTGKIRVRDGGNTTIPSIQMGASGIDGLSLPTTNTIAFITNSTERMRITSGGLIKSWNWLWRTISCIKSSGFSRWCSYRFYLEY